MRQTVVNGYRRIVKLSGVSAVARSLHQLTFVRRIHRSILDRMKNDRVYVEGNLMFVGADPLHLSVYGIHEPLATELVRHLARPEDVALDLGANIGYFSLLLARAVGESGTVYAFEPHPANHALLQKNVWVNRYQNVVIEPKAVSDKDMVNRLFVSEENMAIHHLFEGNRQQRRSISIETVSLDHYFRDKEKRINFIKMDIQGAEPLVVDGMADLLDQNEQIVMLTEFFPFGLMRAGVPAETFLKRLSELGFSLYALSEKQFAILPVDPSRIVMQYPTGSTRHADLLCLKGVSASELMYRLRLSKVTVHTAA